MANGVPALKSGCCDHQHRVHGSLALEPGSGHASPAKERFDGDRRPARVSGPRRTPHGEICIMSEARVVRGHRRHPSGLRLAVGSERGVRGDTSRVERIEKSMCI